MSAVDLALITPPAGSRFAGWVLIDADGYLDVGVRDSLDSCPCLYASAEQAQAAARYGARVAAVVL